MLSPGVEIIPERYSNEYMEPADMTVETERVGSSVSSSDLVDAVTGSTFRVSVSGEEDNKLAKMAHELAVQRYEKLDAAGRQNTNLGMLAIQLFNKLKSDRTRQTSASEVDQTLALAEQIMTKRAQKSQSNKKKSTTKNRPGRVLEAKPAPKRSARTTDIRPTLIVNELEEDEVAAVADYAALNIPSLSSEPFVPDIAVNLEWPVRGDMQSHLFDAHWAILDRRSDGQPSQLTLIRDLRYADNWTLPSVPFVDGESMQVTLEDSEISFEAIRGMFTVRFGVFEIVFLVPTGR